MDIVAKALLAFCASALVLGAMLFVPAGTFEYWQAWLYMGIIFAMMAVVVAYFLASDPQFLERRFQMKEKEAKQRHLQKFSVPIFLMAFLLPGLDYRFGWSHVPVEIVLLGDFFVLLGYGIIFLVFHENSYAGRTIRVEKGQKVIDTGPYSIVRHPMYVGMLVFCLATPVALGSYVALLAFLLVIPVIVYRIGNEEEVLRKELKGYAGYCEKVKYRLVPGIW
ncbi:Phospholipid methyltransferase [Candidatus Anstonella stagnisolia]|nr:Phospholipid methyltransferase [Candidatus Anstonella stagnisolia]